MSMAGEARPESAEDPELRQEPNLLPQRQEHYRQYLANELIPIPCAQCTALSPRLSSFRHTTRRDAASNRRTNSANSKSRASQVFVSNPLQTEFLTSEGQSLFLRIAKYVKLSDTASASGCQKAHNMLPWPEHEPKHHKRRGTLQRQRKFKERWTRSLWSTNPETLNTIANAISKASRDLSTKMTNSRFS